MDESPLRQVRRFNRLVTHRVGALEVNYLRRGRPLAEARLIFEISGDGVDVGVLRSRLKLDLGYLSRLMQSLKTQGLIALTKGSGDARRRCVSLTEGSAERAAYDRLSEILAASMLASLDASEQGRLLTAMGEVERLMRAALITVAAEAPDSADARRCLDAYFRELDARFEGGFDAAADRSARPEDMTPPAGSLSSPGWTARRSGAAASSAPEGRRREIKRVWTAPGARGFGRRAPGDANAGNGGARIRAEDASPGHQPGADRSPRALPARRLPGSRPLQRQPLRTITGSRSALRDSGGP